MKKTFCLLMLVFVSKCSFASDSSYVKRLTDTLSSAAFFGRGYVKEGMQKAGDFIASEMKTIGLTVQQQPFKYLANVFPGVMELELSGKLLEPGKQYLVGAESKPCNSEGKLEQVDSVTFLNRQNMVIITAKDKLTWTVEGVQANYTSFEVPKNTILPVSYKCKVNAELNKKFTANNIIGTIKGNVKPDSIIVFTAHYDHLGGMGSEVYFPGANDNAAGVAMMLDLAKWYAANPPAYTIMFIAFAGEEAGLIGSKYYAGHPTVKLPQISFLINLDLVGNGDEGITVVNATEFAAAFGLLQQINSEKHLLNNIYSRGKAANSDHYWFTEKGVPSFFIYTMGKRKDYHDVNDVAATIPLFEVNDLENLLTTFVQKLTM